MECKKIMRGILGVTAAAMLFCGCGRKETGLDDKLTDYKVSGSDSISLEYMNSDDHKFVTIKKDDDKFDEVQKKLKVRKKPVSSVRNWMRIFRDRQYRILPKQAMEIIP